MESKAIWLGFLPPRLQLSSRVSLSRPHVSEINPSKSRLYSVSILRKTLSKTSHFLQGSSTSPKSDVRRKYLILLVILKPQIVFTKD